LPRGASAPRSLDTNRAVLAGATALLAALAWIVAQMPGARWQMPWLVLTGGLIGFVLFRATFGFSSAFRWLIDERNGRGIAAHAVMLAVTSLLFFPLLALGEVGGTPLNGGATPIGVGFLVGAVLFGAGMQIGGGCASGTLFSLGGGNGKLIATLLFFVVGSAFGAAHMGFWWSLPTGPALTMQGLFGFPLGLALQLALLALLWLGARRLTTHRVEASAALEARVAPSRIEPAEADVSWSRRLREAQWPLVWGGVVLALLNVAVLLLSGKPWGETSAFALWGSKIATSLGLADAHAWAYWQRPGFARQLDPSILTDVTSVMDFAILLGAAVAAAAAGAFRARWGGSRKAWIGAAIGGFLMGYGARLSNGCNIGAYFSAIGAGSISGWVWMAFAVGGSAIGLRLRPLFDLSVLRRDDGPVC
jgi:uncharacterized membrane protein YedE/YeeE